MFAPVIVILAITAGRDGSPEGLQKGFTHGFTVDFTNAKSRDAYLPHPEHQKVGKMIVAVLDGLARNGDAGDAQVEHRIKEQAIALCARFPIY